MAHRPMASWSNGRGSDVFQALHVQLDAAMAAPCRMEAPPRVMVSYPHTTDCDIECE